MFVKTVKGKRYASLFGSVGENLEENFGGLIGSGL